MTLYSPIIVATALLLWAPVAFAHHGEHEEHGESAETAVPIAPDKLLPVNLAYMDKVKPIFEKKCANCHSSQTEYPAYYKIPGIKQYIDHDIRKARKHLDITWNFPFKGHGSIEENFKAIHDEVEDGDMPPWDYRLMHRGAALTDEEKKIVLQWVEESQKALGL